MFKHGFQFKLKSFVRHWNQHFREGPRCIKNKVNEPELRLDFDEFSGKMILNGTFEMKQLKIFVKLLLSDVSCLGNVYKEMLIWIYF